MCESPLLRSSRFSPMSNEQFMEDFWPSISLCVGQILTSPAETHFTQEELCRKIYVVCCQRQALNLYNQMSKFVMEYLERAHDTMINVPDEMFVITLTSLITQYHRAVILLANVFRHLERKLSLNLTEEFDNYFMSTILNSEAIKSRLKTLLDCVSNQSCDPATVMGLVKTLYQINPGYAKEYPRLFSLFIPCLQPARVPEVEMKETQDYLAQLRYQGYPAGSGVLKRKHSPFSVKN